MSADTPIHEDSCQTFRECLGAGAELPPRDLEKLENHIAECPGCREFFGEHRAVWKLLGESPTPAPRTSNSGFLTSVREKIRRGGARRRVAALAAAALVLAGLGLFLYHPRSEDQVIIENMAVLEDLLQADQSPDGKLDVAEVGRELIGLLDGGSLSEEEEWFELMNVLLEENNEKG